VPDEHVLVRYAVPRLLAALFLAGAGLAPVAGPADAAVCSSDTGVTVVVDFHELGGGVQSTCDPDGAGKTATALFPDNGFPLDYVQRTPGFVCRVSGKPADDPCVNTPPADAYWGLFWSNGTNGQWSYATAGAGGQKIPAGGSVAFSWQGSDSRAEPGVAPPQHASQSTPSPSPVPTSKPASGGSGGGTGSTGESAGAPTSTAATTAAPDAEVATTATKSGRHDRRQGGGKHHRAPRTPSPTATIESSEVAPTPDPTVAASAEVSPADSGGLPGWVPISAIGVLTALVIAASLERRRRS
jgi:hypothetical protein